MNVTAFIHTMTMHARELIDTRRRFLTFAEEGAVISWLGGISRTEGGKAQEKSEVAGIENKFVLRDVIFGRVLEAHHDDDTSLSYIYGGRIKFLEENKWDDFYLWLKRKK